MRELALDEERIEISDPHLEKLVDEGEVKRQGFEESFKLAHKRATKVRRLHAQGAAG